MGSWRRAPVVALSLVVLVACGGGGEGGSSTTLTTGTTVAPTTTTLADLTRVLLRTPPRAGFTAIADVYGPLTLEKYLRDFSPDPAGDRTALSAAGFVQGYARGWTDKAKQPTVLAVFLLELRDGPAAASVRDRLLRRVRGDLSFDVPTIEGAVGVSSFVATSGGRQRRHGISFVRGGRVFVVTTQHANPQASTDLVVEVARAQAALVP